MTPGNHPLRPSYTAEGVLEVLDGFEEAYSGNGLCTSSPTTGAGF